METVLPLEDLDLCTIPTKALNKSSRLTLSSCLNPEQVIRSSRGIARDYRGLAEQMDFDYNDIKNFQRYKNPTLKILEAYESKSNSTLGNLIIFLENMERHDVIQDTIEQFKKDARSYIKKNRKILATPSQVPKGIITSWSPEFSTMENHTALTVGDVQNGEMTFYDAYVCYAEEDSQFVWELSQYLESSGLKLFIKGRDLLLGTSEYNSYVELIEERCNRMLIILTPDFLRSSACEFQASFAAGLAIEQRKRKLIPLVLSPCEIPLILKYVSKIDFTKPEIQQWLWEKLIMSIRGTPANIFVFPNPNGAIRRCLPSTKPEISSSHPVITFPPTVNHPYAPVSSSSLSGAEAPPSSISTIAIPTTQTVSFTSVTLSKTSSPRPQRWLRNIKGRFAALNSSSSSAPASSTSSATSGFHSQSGIVFESNENPEAQNISNDTSL